MHQLVSPQFITHGSRLHVSSFWLTSINFWMHPKQTELWAGGGVCTELNLHDPGFIC